MKFTSNVLLKVLGAVVFLGSSAKCSPTSTRSYSCSDESNAQCGATADRYYELIAIYGKYWIKNYPVGYPFGNASAGGAHARIRSFEGGAGFNEKDKATKTVLGPTLTVTPGESLAILLRNNLQEGTPPAPLGDGEDRDTVLKMAYLPQLDVNNKEGAYYDMQKYGFIFEGPTPETIDEVDVPNPENIPYEFNGVNLHLHGMIVNPHLFFPQGTTNMSAPFINVRPGGCYCYKFNIPEDHPTGMYWWHTHRHGSSAMWTWAQGAGFVNIEGKLTEELEQQGVDTTDQLPFVVTDPHFVYSYGETNTYVVASFLGGQNGVLDHPEATYLVNGDFQPTFNLKPGETKWMRYLLATAENLVGFQLVNSETSEIFPVWDIASDGINYEKPIVREQYVHGGGMRQDILLQFPSEGTYFAMSKGLGGLQFFGTGPDDQLLATFVVSGEAESPLDIASMIFTLPLANDRNIEESEITVKRTVTFDIVGNASIVPFPQFLVNGKAYQNDLPMYDLTLDGHAEEWTIVSTQNATHPFHIHVLPFQVKSAHTNNTNPRYNDFVGQSKSGNIWRDVDLIPPYGTMKVWLRLTPSAYTNLNGKSVFHCHFLAHEDTGMIQAIRFIDPTKPIDDDSNADKSTTETTSDSTTTDDGKSTADESTADESTADISTNEAASSETTSEAASRNHKCYYDTMVKGTMWFVWLVISG